MPTASLIKTLTILTSLEENGEEKIISLSPDSISQNGDFGLFVNEKWKIGDLAKITMLSSANDGAFALAFDTKDSSLIKKNDANKNEDNKKKEDRKNDTEYNDNKKKDFFIKMRKMTEKIGIYDIDFENVTGLDIVKETLNKNSSDTYSLQNLISGATGSAESINKLNLYALATYPRIFETSTLPQLKVMSESGFVHNVKNTNTILSDLPNLLFSKTGNTLLSGGNLSIIFMNKNNHLIAITLLGSTTTHRFSDMQKIIDVLLNY